MEPNLHKISAVLTFLFNASLSKIIVEDLTVHDCKSEFTQPRYNLKSDRSSYRCSWIQHLEAKNPSSQKPNLITHASMLDWLCYYANEKMAIGIH